MNELSQRRDVDSLHVAQHILQVTLGHVLKDDTARRHRKAHGEQTHDMLVVQIAHAKRLLNKHSTVGLRASITEKLDSNCGCFSVGVRESDGSTLKYLPELARAKLTIDCDVFARNL